MSNNPNFPARQGLTISNPGTNSGLNMPTAGMPGQPNNAMGMNMGMGQQINPLQQLRGVISQTRQLDFSDTSATGINYETVNSFFQSGGDNGPLESQRAEEVKNQLAPVIYQIAKEFADQNGKYAIIENGFKALATTFTNGTTAPSAEKFWTTVLKSASNRRTIGLNIGIVMAYNVGQILLSGGSPDQLVMKSILNGSSFNIFAMEMARYLTQSQTALHFSMSNGPIEDVFRNGLLKVHNHVSDDLSKCFCFFDIPDPYDKFIPCFDLKTDPKANPHNFVIGQYGRPDVSYGPEPKWGYDSKGQLDAAGQEATATYEYLRKKRAAMKIETSDYEEPDSNAISYGLPTRGRTDFINMTKSNIKEFDWKSKLVNVPGTDWYIADDDLVSGLRNTYFGGEYTALRTQWGKATLFGFFSDGRLNPDALLVDIGNYTVDKFLTDPKSLLPLLEENNGKVSVATQHDTKLDEEGRWDLDDVVECLELDHQPLVTLIPEHINKDWEKNQKRIKIYHEEIAKKANKTTATSNAETRFEEIVLSSETEAKNVYRFLKPLIKTGGGYDGSYFDFIEYTYERLGKYFSNVPGILMVVDQHLSKELERWMVERHGFSNNESSKKRFCVDTLTDCYYDLRSILGDLCPAAYEELLDKKRGLKLIQRSRCFLDESTTDDFLTDLIEVNSPTYDVEKQLIEKTVLYCRELVVTRVSRCGVPVKDSRDTVSYVKRSERPDLFAIIERSYGKLADRYLNQGAEQIIIFTDAGDSTWTFQSSSYDPNNVGTMRQLHNNKDLLRLKHYYTNVGI